MREEDFTKKAEVEEIVADLKIRLAGIHKKAKWI